MEAIVHIFSDHFYIHIVTLGKIISFWSFLKKKHSFFCNSGSKKTKMINWWSEKYNVYIWKADDSATVV